MTQYYVRADGDDGSAGTGTSAATAWRTLDHACDVAGAGDFVDVMDDGGIFFIASQHSITPVGAAGNILTIRARSGDTPIFDGTGGVFDIDEAILLIAAGSQYATISGLTVRNNGQTNALGRGIGISSSVSPAKVTNITITGCTVHDVNTRAIGGGGDNITISNCTVYNFSLNNKNEALCGSPCGGWAAGIASFQYTNGTLPVNWVIDGCHVYNGWGEGIICLRITGVTVTDCIIENAYSVGLYCDKAHDVVAARNLVIVNDSTYNRQGRPMDGIKWAVEGTPVHASYGVDNIDAYNNIIAGVRDAFSWFTDSSNVASTYRNISIWFNSTYSLTRSGFTIGTIGSGANVPSGCEARNNILYAGMTTLNNSSAWTFTHNDWPNGIPSVGTHTNSIAANPLYVNPNTDPTPSTDFILAGGTPCEGAGIAIASVTTDYAGTARFDPPTIGAFEHFSSADETLKGQVGSFATGTDVVGSTITVTGVGFAPLALILWWSGRTEAVDAVGTETHRRGMGFAVSPTDRRAITNISIDNVNPIDSASRHTPNACVSVLLDTTTVDGELDVQSMDADGFTLVVDNQFSQSYRIHYLAIGGPDVLQAVTGQFTAPLATGNQDTVIGFEPDALFFLSTNQTTAPPITGVDSRFCFGAALSASEQAVIAGGSNDGVTPSQAVGYCRDGECIALPSSTLTVLELRAAFVQMNATGFRLNFTEVSGIAPYIFYLAIRGGRYKLGTLLTETDTVTPITISGLDFQPSAGMFVSAMRAESAADTLTDHDTWSIGAVSTPNIRGAQAIADEDAVATSDTNTALEFDAVYANVSNAGAIQGLMDVQSIGVSSVSLIMDDADPSQSFVWYLAVGSEGATPAPDVTVTPTVDALAGAPETLYYLIVNDALGNRLAVIQDYIALEAARAVNGLGVLVFEVPGTYPLDTFKVDGLVELWRAPKGGSVRLEFEQLWFIRERYKIISGGVRTWRIVAYDLNFLIGNPSGNAGRIVAYADDIIQAEASGTEAFTDKAGPADDVVKQIMRENLSTAASDSDRSLAAYFLTVQVDFSDAPTIRKHFARRNVLSTFQEICQASITAGTYLAWDIVCLVPPNSGSAISFQLQTFTGQRGIDHRLSSNQPVLIGPDYGNLDEVEFGIIHTDEANYIYAGGQGEEDVRAIRTASDTARINVSPYNRRERFIDASQVGGDLVALQDEADSALRAGRPRLTLRGTLIDTDQSRYGIHWSFGDYVTAQIDGYSFDARLDALALRFDLVNGERITAKVRAESVA